MYPTGDPRQALTAAVSEPIFPLRAAQFIEFDQTPPSEITTMGSRTWLVRSENLVIAYTQAKAGDILDCSSDLDEVALLISGTTRARLDFHSATNSTAREDALGPLSFTVIPAGKASVRSLLDGVVVRVFAQRSTMLSRKCLNSDTYERLDPNVPAFKPWNDAATHSEPFTQDYGSVESSPHRFGRIFRTDSSMINVFYPETGPRDPSALSPHSHAEFDQVSLQLEGDYIHHVRAPWGPDSNEWQDDVHRRCSGPAVAIFPPPLIHTSQAVGNHVHQLVDIFGPPRADFAARQGWLLNAGELAAGPTND